MKNLIRTATLALAAVVSSFAVAQNTAQPEESVTPAAQERPAPAKARPTLDAREQAVMQKPVADGFQPMNLGLLIKRLELTPQQQEEAKQLNARYMKMHRSLPENMPMDKRVPKVKSLMEERDVAFKAFLTKEQVETYGTLLTPTGAKVSPTAEPAK